jgi:acyl carrier protein
LPGHERGILSKSTRLGIIGLLQYFTAEMESVLITTTYSDSSEETVLSCVRKQLGIVIGDPELIATQIGMDTKFGEDLELESIEFIALADRLRSEFGDRVNFVEFIATKNVDDVISLKVGDVVRYVASSLDQTKA